MEKRRSLASGLRRDIAISSVFVMCCAVYIGIAYPKEIKVPKQIIQHTEKTVKMDPFDGRKVFVRYAGSNLPSEQEMDTFDEIKFDGIMLDFPSNESEQEDYIKKFEEYQSVLLQHNKKFFFLIQNISERGTQSAYNDILLLSKKIFHMDNYLRAYNKPFVVVDIKKKNKDMRDKIASLRSIGVQIYYAVTSDEGHNIISCFEDGAEAYVTYGSTDQYAWSANPDSFKNVYEKVNERGMPLLITVMDVYEASRHIRHRLNHPPEYYDPKYREYYDDDPTPEPEIPDPDAPPTPEPEPTPYRHRRRKHSNIPGYGKESRTDLEISWDYAKDTGASAIIVLFKNNTGWAPCAEGYNSIKGRISEFRDKPLIIDN